MRIKLRIYSSIITPAAILMALFTLLSFSSSNSKNAINGPLFSDKIAVSEVNRVEVLENFFDNYNSPLRDHADTFVEVADKYGMDYTILPAISCMESTCGKYMIPGSYNPFGWGIHGNSSIAFNSFDEAIETVGKGMSDIYLSKGLDTPDKIAPVYTPPNSNGWLKGVNFFIEQIDKEEVSNQVRLASNLELH
ncbi:glucosaminidase domain-containing protein [Patescibacteria group bacterium]|nr:glucosaminidase domain-containing protein [Patescibacteria group bacterium]